MIPVGRLAPGDQWDQTMLDDLFANRLYETGLKFRRYEGYPNTDGACVILPGRYWHQSTDQITEAIQRYDWVLMFRVGDEEDLLDIGKIEHDNIRFWVQTPKMGIDYGAARLFGVGYTPHFRSLPSDPPDKVTGVYLSCQMTHGRRKECFEALENWHGDKVVRPTEGFTDGFEPAQYVQGVVSAKVCPAPSGAVSVDTFRFFEALEAHCMPLADDVSPVDGPTGYWHRLFGGDVPFPILTHYSDLPGYIDDILAAWPAKANRVAAWWMREKRALAMALRDDLTALGAV